MWFPYILVACINYQEIDCDPQLTYDCMYTGVYITATV